MKKFPFLPLEIVIWFILAGLITFMGIDRFKDNSILFSRYTLEFQDIDGLNVGSPVRFMGYQVGHVTKVELLDSKIYVSFKITEKKTKIPNASVARIEFSGIGGSKSLEIMPPEKEIACQSIKKGIYAKEPIRINSIMEVQSAIFENVLDFCRGILAFLSRESIDKTRKNIKHTALQIEETNKSIDKNIEKINSSGKNITEQAKNIKQTIDEQNKNIDTIYKSINILAEDKKFKDNMDEIQKTIDNFSQNISPKKTNEQVCKVTEDLNNINSNINQFSKSLNKVKNREVEYINKINDSLQKTTDKMQNFIDFSKSKLKIEESKDKINSKRVS